MFPTLLKIGSFGIHTYGVMMALGVFLSLWFLYIQAKKQGLEASRIMDMAFFTLLVALAGAKLTLLFGSFSYYTKNFRELLNLARSGGVFQGGLVAGVVFALWYLRRYRIPTWKTGDIVGPSLALAHTFGRVGCFFAGCCFGRPSSGFLGVTFHSEYAHNLTALPLDSPIHPVQLYEATLNFLNFIFLFILLKRKRFDGQVFSFYVISYSLIRYFTEFYRGDHPEKAFLIKNASPYLTMTFPQLFCIIGIIAGISLYFILKKRKRACFYE